MDSDAWVQLALAKLGCAQKDLASRLGVSPGQISKWKNGEHMSSDMEKRFREITGIESLDARFVLTAGSIDDAQKWEALILHLAELAEFDNESGYHTVPLQEYDLLNWSTFRTLEEMGVKIPQPFPAELDIDYDDESLEEEVYQVINSNPYSNMIKNIFNSLTDVYGFYAAYISDLVDSDNMELFEVGMNVESCLMALAACKIDADQNIATKFGKFKYETTKNYRDWLNELKDTAYQAGKPLKAELLKLVYDDHDSLGVDAEAEWMGFNDSRLHPDIYMDELLRGMRVIHQVLPAIVEKLGIELELDLSELTAAR